MTTSTLVACPRDNRNDVLVEVMRSGCEVPLRIVRLEDGEQQHFFVGNGITLRVSEVERMPPFNESGEK